MEKLKILSIGGKKMKKDEKKNWEKLVEIYAPDLYDNYYATGEKESLKEIVLLNPEVMIVANDMKDTIGFVKKAKEVHPEGVILVILGMVDDEQLEIERFCAAGAYKCYPIPLSIDTLIHDMYVAMNLE